MSPPVALAFTSMFFGISSVVIALFGYKLTDTSDLSVERLRRIGHNVDFCRLALSPITTFFITVAASPSLLVGSKAWRHGLDGLNRPEFVAGVSLTFLISLLSIGPAAVSALLVIVGGLTSDGPEVVMTPTGPDFSSTFSSNFDESVAPYFRLCACCFSAIGMMLAFSVPYVTAAGRVNAIFEDFSRIPHGKCRPKCCRQRFPRSSAKVEVFFRISLVHLLYRFVRSWLGLHIIAFLNHIMVGITFLRQILQMSGGAGADTRQSLLFGSLCLIASSLTVHIVAVAENYVGGSASLLTAVADRHFRASTLLNGMLMGMKVLFLALPIQAPVKDCGGTIPCVTSELADGQPDVPYAWSCHSASVCPTWCTESMHGTCSVAAVEGPEPLQCVCTGTSNVRLVVIFSYAVSLSLQLSFTLSGILKYMRSKHYRKAVSWARCRLIAYLVLCLAPQTVPALAVAHLATRAPTLKDDSAWAVALAMGPALPAALLANEVKWTLASWAPPTTFHRKGALLKGQSAVRLLRPFASVCAFLGALAAAMGHRMFQFAAPTSFALCLTAVSALFVPSKSQPWDREASTDEKSSLVEEIGVQVRKLRTARVTTRVVTESARTSFVSTSSSRERA